jgi:hypothetical protein
MAKAFSQVLRAVLENSWRCHRQKRLRHLLGVEIFLETRKGHPNFLWLAAGSMCSALVSASFMGGSRGGAETRRVGENDG